MFLVVLIGIAAVVLGFLFWHREAGVEAEAVVKEKMREEKSRYPVGLPVKFDKPTSEKKLKNEDGTRRMVENNEADELKIENVSNKSSIQLDATQPDKSLNLDVTQKPLEAQEEPKEADVKSGDSKKKKKHKKRNSNSKYPNDFAVSGSKSSRSSSKKSKKKSKRSKKKDADASGAPNKPDDQPNV
ncbi:hypothetical protein M3Y95_00329300 [Aphelenchoides besseyi]|nr:hypothetical protein M3Y95_00329300 [Aphelenchoides besseyi]